MGKGARRVAVAHPLPVFPTDLRCALQIAGVPSRSKALMAICR